MKKELSIIIPFAGEYPQVLFTIQSVAQSLLRKDVDFEIIAVDNYCDELEKQWTAANTKAANEMEKNIDSDINGDLFKLGFDCVPKCYQENKSGAAIKAAAGKNPWLRYIPFDGWLSHWESKRIACEEAKGDAFLFVDAHCVPSDHIADMFSLYRSYFSRGTFHMPLTYKIMEWHRLIYKLVIKDNFWGYSFSAFDQSKHKSIYEVPCMSTCGMMISREIYEKIGGWPKDFGAYGGGENFVNYTLSVLGLKKWIYPPATLFHHGEKRDYHSTYDGTLKNRLAAHYLFGGNDIINKYANSLIQKKKGRPDVIMRMVSEIKSNYLQHRNHIKRNEKQTPEQFLEYWEYKIEE